jgi:pimeloyl-ACP methyl ester carboxylesterase
MDQVLTLMLDGIWGRPKRFDGLLQMLRASCGPAEIFHYDSSGRVSFEELGSQLAEEIRRRDQRVNLIGFSMGGLVVRAAHLLERSLPIRRAAFLNSPHAGSLLAYLFPVGGIRQIRPSDRFIQRLKRVEWKIPTLATWCPCDTMVIPGRSARLSEAQETICCAIPMHTWPIFSGYIWRRVVRFLSDDAAGNINPHRDAEPEPRGAERAYERSC